MPSTKKLTSGPQRKHSSEKKGIISRKVQEGNVSGAELRFGVAEFLSESPRSWRVLSKLRLTMALQI